jgi:hypothetical protein
LDSVLEQASASTGSVTSRSCSATCHRSAPKHHHQRRLELAANHHSSSILTAQVHPRWWSWRLQLVRYHSHCWLMIQIYCAQDRDQLHITPLEFSIGDWFILLLVSCRRWSL